jgi:Tfp pilus assembly protein FimT
MEIIVVVGIIGAVAVIAAPLLGGTIQSMRLNGDARGVSNATAVAKMRAAAEFTRVRLRVDLPARTHRLETFNKTDAVCCWIPQGGATALSTGVSFGFGAVGTAPPATQTTIAQASECLDDMGVAIANTACIMFNSRGVPIDNTLASTGADALYVTDGTAVFGVTVAATGMVRMWRTPPAATPTWALN